jgi:hypothetical protein
VYLDVVEFIVAAAYCGVTVQDVADPVGYLALNVAILITVNHSIQFDGELFTRRFGSCYT